MTKRKKVARTELAEAREWRGRADASVKFEAWNETLASVGMRLRMGTLEGTERQLSLAAIGLIEERLEQTWPALRRSGCTELIVNGQPCDIDRAHEQILDQLVRLRVALTAQVDRSFQRSG